MKSIALLAVTFLLTAVQLARADKVDDLIAHAMKDRHIPGLALAVIKDGKPIKVQAYGLANIEFNAPVKPSTPFLLASMTKSFTATGIMMLAEHGKLALDDPISKYLDDTPEAWKGITIRMLLSHTAGLKDRCEEVPYDVSKWKLNYTRQEMLKAAEATAPDFKPGERFQYSDQGFFLLGMIIEKVSGELYPNFLKEKIFDPLGMKDSSTIVLSRIVNGLATGYTLVGTKWYHNSRRTDYGMVSHFGMISTVEDLEKWDAALDGEKLLKRASFTQMWTPANQASGHPAYTAYGAYGLGWFLDRFNGHRSVGHAGSTGTAFLKLPEDKLTVIVLTNLEQIAGGDAPGIAADIARTYLPALEWTAIKPKSDPHPEHANALKAALNGLVAGEFDVNLYEPAYGVLIKSAALQQQRALAPLGLVSSVDFLEESPFGNGVLVRYRVNFKAVPLYGTATFGADGKIAMMEVEPERTYR